MRTAIAALLSIAAASCAQEVPRPRPAAELLQNLRASIEEKGWEGSWLQHAAEIRAHAASGNSAEVREFLKGLPELFESPEAKKANVTIDAEALHRHAQAQTLSRKVMALADAQLDGLEDLDCTTPEFKNWGLTVSNHPAATCVPRNVDDVQRIVRYAKAHGKKVRSAGYRHTWESFYSADDEILVSLLPLKVAEELPAKHPDMDRDNLLQGIDIVEEHDGGALVKLMAGTTNYHLFDWVKENGYKYTLPFNVIMVEVTIGGIFSMICHGSDLRAGSTLSDLVTEVEFVNAEGDVQVVNDTKLLQSAAGAMGMMGLITSMTVKFDKMTYAELRPLKVDTRLAIPPPAGYTPHPEIWNHDTVPTPAELAAAQADFELRVSQHYYQEWFWFTMNKQVWVNTFANNGSAADAKEYPGPLRGALQEASQAIAEFANNLFISLLPDKAQVSLLANLAMEVMPPSVLALNSGEVTTYLNNAQHFRRGIQNSRVLDMEWELPIPVNAVTGVPDLHTCQTAWWDVINATYEFEEATGKVPMKLTLELRIMGGSKSTLAPEAGNDLTCSIEILTTATTKAEDWLAFMQLVVDKWSAIRDAEGGALNMRPHWAKQWKGLTFDGTPIVDFLKNVYSAATNQFTADMSAIAADGGYTLADMADRFSNPLIDELEFFNSQ